MSQTINEPMTNDLYPVMKGGSVMGRNHLNKRVNKQDNMCYLTYGENAVGVVSDGAGSSKYSEVGSFLAANYIANYMLRLAYDGIDQNSFQHVYVGLYNDLLRGIVENIDDIYGDPNPLIDSAFLFTVVAFVYTPKETFIFMAGDGKFLIDDTVYEFELSNVQGYHLMGVPQINHFGVIRVPDGWKRIAVASDGFENGLMNQVWGQKHPNSLQRQMNVWSDAKHFSDDATIVTMEHFYDNGKAAYINADPLTVSSEQNTFDKFFKPK